MYILAAADYDTKGEFVVEGKSIPLSIQGWTGYVGQYYNREFAKDGVTVTAVDSPYSKQDNIAWFASHRHQGYPSMNKAYEYSYLYKYEIELPSGVTKVTLPDNRRIKILAITVAKNDGEGCG